MLSGCGGGGDSDSSKTYSKVQSELFKAAEYDKVKQRLTLTFTDGKVQHFGMVPGTLGEEFMTASSPDKIFKQKVEGKYNATDAAAP
ncbi:MAG: KTSC domain-containing protein [Verrucomicrobiota bacterium]